MEIIATLVLIALTVVLLIVLVVVLANRDAYFTMVAQDSTKYISVGESLKYILANITGFKLSATLDLDNRQWIVPASDEEDRLKAFFRNRSWVGLQRFLWQKLGVVFFGFLWPQVYVQWFNIRSIKTVKEVSEVAADAPLRARIVDSHGDAATIVNELRFVVPRPVYLDGVELAGDNAKINFLLLPVYRQVIPALPVYTLRGDFFTLLDAAIQAAVVDFASSHRVAVYKTERDVEGNVTNPHAAGQFAYDFWDPMGTIIAHGEDPNEYRRKYEPSPLTYSLWLKLTKAGENSPLERHFHTLNVNAAYLQRLDDRGRTELAAYARDHLAHGHPATGALPSAIPSGIIPRFGFALVSFRNVEWEPHPSTKPLADALLAKETEFHTAEGVREKAKGERDRILFVREGEAARYDALLSALIKNGVDPNVAAQVAATQIRMEQVAASKLTTYVEGGASAQPVVPLSTGAT